ncbi:MAG: restriction endonuclease subunit S, partial [Methanobacteriota archaeon]
MLKFKSEKEFKETEMGELPKEWEITVLGDKSKFTIIMGQSPPSKYYNQNGDGIPFIQGKKEFGDLYVETETYTTKCAKIAPPYSVLITVRAPVGELNITKGKLCIGRGVAAVFNKNRSLLENRFIYYVLKGLNRYLSMLGERGTTYDSITKEELDNFAVPFPKSVERLSIASVLSWFDDLIENKKRQNEILEKTAMAIFKSWFIDFEPFKDSEFVDSELGKIPKTWKVRSIGKIADFRNGLSYKGVEKFSEPAGYLFITLNNVLEGGGFKPEYSWIKSNRIKKHHFLKEGDLIIANTEQTKVGRLIGCPALVT